MQAQHCSFQNCFHAAIINGLCSRHYDEQIHPSSGVRYGRVVTMAGKLFETLTFGAIMQQEDESGRTMGMKPVLPMVKVPFIFEQDPDFIYVGPIDDIDPTRNRQQQRVEPHALKLREELFTGIMEKNSLDKPIVFLVVTNIPHTSIYILHQGRLYSVGYGYYGEPAGALYSIDIPLGTNLEARIVWIGILTSTIMLRLQHEFDHVTEVNFIAKPLRDEEGKIVTDEESKPITVVDRLMIFMVPKPYGGPSADASATEWNCTKWAMNILFGGKKPANFRELVSRANPGLSEVQLANFLSAYRNGKRDKASNDGFLTVLDQINHASFPRGGRRMRITKRKPIKMRKTRRTRKTRRMR
jgi:hypothetical protein